MSYDLAIWWERPIANEDYCPGLTAVNSAVATGATSGTFRRDHARVVVGAAEPLALGGQ
jgi:hypothetical protein